MAQLLDTIYDGKPKRAGDLLALLEAVRRLEVERATLTLPDHRTRFLAALRRGIGLLRRTIERCLLDGGLRKG